MYFPHVDSQISQRRPFITKDFDFYVFPIRWRRSNEKAKPDRNLHKLDMKLILFRRDRPVNSFEHHELTRENIKFGSN